MSTQHQRALGALLAAAALGSSGCVSEPSETGRPIGPGPDVVLISIDTLRADRMSLYGHTRDTTPGLTRMAEEAIVFDRAYHNGGGTLPSHMTMMTSLHPRAHWVTPSTGRTLPPERTTLAEVFHRHGWDTAAFVDGGWMAPKFGFAQGFDIYEDAGGGGFEKVLPAASNWLADREERPAFLFLHTYDVHSQTDRLPYECPDGGHWRYLEEGFTPVGFDGCRDGRCASELLSQLDAQLAAKTLDPADALGPTEIEWMKALYDGCIRWADDQLGEFFEHLQDLGIYDRALIVVTSDHGEEFLDHGRLLHHQNGFEEIARVPLIVKLPFGGGGGRRVGELAALVDLMPTLLEYARLPIPEVAQGTSLRPAIESSVAVRSDLHVFSVLRGPRYKYFADTGDVYDLTKDTTETEAVADLDADLRTHLQERLWGLVNRDIALQEALDQGLEPPRTELTPEERQELEALGYLVTEEPEPPQQQPE
ncbi:MAG: sulfatase [Thermoanaerobaculia bacterium]|nr:sulfatase [Thermoanaerobaculia bacterium]